MEVLRFTGTQFPVTVCSTSAEARQIAADPRYRITQYVWQSRLKDEQTFVFEYVNPEEAARRGGLPLISAEVRA